MLASVTTACMNKIGTTALALLQARNAGDVCPTGRSCRTVSVSTRSHTHTALAAHPLLPQPIVLLLLLQLIEVTPHGSPCISSNRLSIGAYRDRSAPAAHSTRIQKPEGLAVTEVKLMNLCYVEFNRVLFLAAVTTACVNRTRASANAGRGRPEHFSLNAACVALPVR